MSGQERFGGTPVESGASARRRRLRLRTVASVMASVAVASLVNAGSAGAAIGDPDYRDTVNKFNGMCLDVAHASTDPGAQVVQATCWGGHNQKWRTELQDTDWWTGVKYYRLRVLHSDQCLDVDGGSTYDGARISQWHCYYGHNQQFRLVSLGYGQYRLQARHSGKCVVAEASTRHAAPITQRSCYNDTTEHWSFR